MRFESQVAGIALAIWSVLATAQDARPPASAARAMQAQPAEPPAPVNDAQAVSTRPQRTRVKAQSRRGADPAAAKVEPTALPALPDGLSPPTQSPQIASPVPANGAPTATSSAGTSASTASAAIAGRPREPLRVHAVGDQLIGFLDGVIRDSQEPGRRIAFGPLREKISRAVDENPDALALGEQRSLVGEQTREAFAAFLPQVSSNSDGGQRRYGRNTVIGSPEREQNGLALGLTIRQTVYDFGAIGGSVDAARQRERAVDARIDAKRSELLLRAIFAYYEVYRSRRLLTLAKMNALARDEIVSFVRERADLGGSARSDVLRAQARLADAQAGIVAADNRLKAAEAAYREAFASDAPAELELPEDVALDPLRYNDPRAAGLANPQALEAFALRDAARSDAASAKARLLPSLGLEANVTRRDLFGNGDPATDRSVVGVIRYNFYTGGAETARRNQAVQRAAQAEQEAQSAVRQLERAIRQGTGDVENSDAALATRRDAVNVAIASLAAVREQFAYRRGTLLDLLRAQEDLFVVGRDLIDTLTDRATARFRLLHLTADLVPVMRQP
jgi:adhesin transport system outer membrane protein